MRGESLSRQSDGFRGGLAARLRREAAADRPAFSVEFQGRLARRLAAEGKRPRAAREDLAEPVAVRSPRTWIPLAAAVVAAGALTMLVALGTNPAEGVAGRRGDRLAVPRVPAGVAEADGPVGLERLPMFDEIDAGVREGISSLAAALIEPPDWSALAVFDARALVEPAAGAGGVTSPWSPVTP